MGEPRYVLHTFDMVISPCKTDTRPKYIKVIMTITTVCFWLLVWLSIEFESFLFITTPELVMPFYFGVFICLLNPKPTERTPELMELQFYDDCIIMYKPEHYCSKKKTQKETYTIMYSSIKECIYKKKSKRLHIYGDVALTAYILNADGTLPESPSEDRMMTDFFIYFWTNFMDSIDIVKEIEEHSPINVRVEETW